MIDEIRLSCVRNDVLVELESKSRITTATRMEMVGLACMNLMTYLGFDCVECAAGSD